MALTKVSYSMIQGAAYNVLDYGASPSATPAENCTAIQAAINAANAAGGGQVFIPPGTYTLDVVDYGDTTIISIKLLNNVALMGAGAATILKTKNAAYGAGAFYRVIGSRDDTLLSNASISNLTIDGNRAGGQGATTQASNINLRVASSVTISNIKSINANGEGIQLSGTTSAPMVNVKITQNYVESCARIGIQCAQFNLLTIENNIVNDATDNGIDIYGDKGTTTTNGINFTIVNNVIQNTQVGIFCETVAQGSVVGNTVDVCTIAGLVVNRINGQPNAINLTGNTVKGSPIGAFVSGDTGGINIAENFFSGFSNAGVRLGDGGSGNASLVNVSRNFFSPANTTVPIILLDGNVISFCVGQSNVVNSTGMTTAYHLVDSASTVNGVVIRSFVTIPPQTGPDSNPAYALFQDAEFYAGFFNNVSGNSDIPIADNTAGTLRVTAHQASTGSSVWLTPYVKRGGTLILGTPQKAIITSDPISSITVSSNNARVAAVTTGTYLRFGSDYTQIF